MFFRVGSKPMPFGVEVNRCLFGVEVNRCFFGVEVNRYLFGVEVNRCLFRVEVNRCLFGVEVNRCLFGVEVNRCLFGVEVNRCLFGVDALIKKESAAERGTTSSTSSHFTAAATVLHTLPSTARPELCEATSDQNSSEQQTALRSAAGKVNDRFDQLLSRR